MSRKIADRFGFCKACMDGEKPLVRWLCPDCLAWEEALNKAIKSGSLEQIRELVPSKVEFG